MHCVDVIRELSVPTGEPDAAVLAEHLAGCARCASRAEQSARLDRLWAATRPAEPSAAAWDQMWSNIAAALDRPPVPAAAPARPAPAAPGPWRRSALAAFTIAQAAAILAAFTLAWRESARRHPAEHGPSPVVAAAPVSAPAAVPIAFEVDIEQDQVPLIGLDRRDLRLLDQARVDGPNAVDEFFPMFNAVESIAALQ